MLGAKDKEVMDKSDYRWLIDRSDRIRRGITTSAAIVLTAMPIFIAGLSYFSKVIIDSKPDEGVFVLEIVIPLVLLGIAWLCVFFAAGSSLGAIARANGFNIMDYPSQHPKNSLVDVRIDCENLSAQLDVAAEAQLRAVTSLRDAAWSIVLAIFFLVATFIARSYFA